MLQLGAARQTLQPRTAGSLHYSQLHYMLLAQVVVLCRGQVVVL
jgi:hypothetical protein